MKPTMYGPAARLALVLGLVSGATLIPSASMAGVDTVLLADAASASVAPKGVQLVQADATPVEKPVTYTSEQADRGKKRFESDCVECHGDDLKGGMNGGPPLRGLQFEAKFAEGAPASSMYLFMSTMMPPNDPGRYSESTYADLMAYVLKRNGYQEGAELPSDVDALDYLIMEK